MRKLESRRWRDELGLFAAEGEDLVEAARAQGIEPVDLLVAGENVSAELLVGVSTLPHPARAIGVYRKSDLPQLDPADSRPLGLALWRLADPGNVGTLLRTADPFGAFVALSEGCADPDRTEGGARLGGCDFPRADGAVRQCARPARCARRPGG